MNDIVYLNGVYISKQEASLSPDDRGFIFADGVYEVIKYYNGNPFRYEDHCVRLERSLREIQIEFDRIGDLEGIFEHLLVRNGLKDTHAGVYLQITRGVNQRVHHFPAEITPTIYAFAFSFPSWKENLQKGIRVITREDIRWMRCDIKSIALLPNTMLYNQAVTSGAGECILLRNGIVTEATHSSVLGVKNGTVITHPLSHLILPGITRKVILMLCAQYGISFEERPLTEKELFDVDELIIAGTGSEITPVVQVNDRAIENGMVGEVTRLLQKKFFELTDPTVLD